MQSALANTSAPLLYPVFVPRSDSSSDFNSRLAALRKERGLTQQALAGRVECHVQQLKR
jgi:hypothetical protein